MEPNKYQGESDPACNIGLRRTQVRKAWAAKIAKLWGWHVRARITLRKRFGREPTQDEISEINAKDEPFLDVTEEEVMEAFTKGEEASGISF